MLLKSTSRWKGLRIDGLILNDWYFWAAYSVLETCNCLVTRGHPENTNTIIRDVRHTSH